MFDNHVYRDHGGYGKVMIATFDKREDAIEYARGKTSMVLPMSVSYPGMDITFTMNNDRLMEKIK